MTLLFFNIGMGEVVFALLIALLLFGAKGFPSFARRMGKGIQEIRRTSGELQKDIKDSADQVRDEIEQAKPEDPRSSERNDEKDRRNEG